MKDTKLKFLFCLFVLILHLTGCNNADIDGGDLRKIHVEINVSLDFMVNPFQTKTRADVSGFRRRFIVDIYREDNITAPYARKVIIYDNIDIEGNMFRLPVSFQLDPLQYKLVVWTDHILAGTDCDYFYNTETLSDIYCIAPYRASTIYRDALYGSNDLDLLPYRGKDKKQLTVDVAIERAVAPIRLLTTDYDRFFEKHGNSVASQSKMNFSYSFFTPLGFDAINGLPIRSSLNVSFAQPVAEVSEIEDNIMIMNDYIFVGSEESFVVLNIDVKHPNNTLLNQMTNIRIPYRKGYLTTLKSNFLTSGQSSNINVNVDFDDDILIDLDN